MKNKTSKLRNLEKNRYSILTNDFENCYLCDDKADHIHEVFAGGNRKMSMANGFCLPLCYTHHNIVQVNYTSGLELKKLMQRKYEENHTREEFIRLVGKSFL